MGKEKQNLNNFALPVNITDNLIAWLPTNFWMDPTKKVCYLSIVDGYVIDRMIDKFNEGLKDIIIDDTERKNHILNNMIYGISSTESNTRRVKWLSQIKNIYTRNILKEDISDMPHFDFVVQNPPYNGSLHLDFFKKGLDLLNPKGKMIIIEPSIWLIELRQYISKKQSWQMKLYKSIKNDVKEHIKKIIIDNYDHAFNINLYVPCSITYIDKEKIYDTIDFKCMGYSQTVKNIEDCNLIGNIELIKSIFDKIKDFDKLENHLYIPNKSNKIEGNYYYKFNNILSHTFCTFGGRSKSDNFWINNQLKYYYNALGLEEISNIVCKRRDNGNKITDKDADCITGTKTELENWQYYQLNNSLPLFLSICLTIDMNNNVAKYIPWIVDKKYTDKEIYDMFGFTEEEIKLIEITIKKYKRYTPFVERYTWGPEEITDEEVQKFMNGLNNAEG